MLAVSTIKGGIRVGHQKPGVKAEPVGTRREGADRESEREPVLTTKG
jgi:hypothetical protein